MSKSDESPAQYRSLHRITWYPERKFVDGFEVVVTSAEHRLYTDLIGIQVVPCDSIVWWHALEGLQVKSPNPGSVCLFEFTKQINHLHILNPKFASSTSFQFCSLAAQDVLDIVKDI
jgi:hypothetical protein